MEKLDCMIVYSSKVIDTDTPRIKDRFSERFMHRILVLLYYLLIVILV